MASEEKEKISMTKEGRKDFLMKAQKRLEACIKADGHNREKAIDDLKFVNGDMWDEGEKARRNLRKRPVLQIPLLPKYINQLVGEQRMNRPKIKVRPVDSKADIGIAKIREGIISNIEYLSAADIIYDQAFSMLVKCGYGAWRVLSRYTDENPFLQELYLELIPNPLVVYLDPNAKDPLHMDGMYGFVITKMEREEYKEQFPGKEVPSEKTFEKAKGIRDENWYTDDTITVAEYYIKEPKKKTLCLMRDGSVMEKTEAEKAVSQFKSTVSDIKKQNPNVQVGEMLGPEIVKEREIEEFCVYQYIITGTDILEKNEWKGQYIPVVLAYGRETNIEGKRYIQGLIRNAKDSQRLYNYWYTSAAETIALAPKNPWIGSAKMFEGYEEDYATANIDNVPFLKSKHDPNFPGQLPRREPPAQPPAAMFVALDRAKSDIMDTLGMYQRDLGAQGREVSGIAIRQAQKPGDTGTFDFFDNLVRAIRYTGRIINDALPGYYDTERDARIRNIDDSETFAPINTTVGNAIDAIKKNADKFSGMDVSKLEREAGEKGYTARLNDITIGKYDVVVTTGPTHSTQRQEAAENFLELMKTPLGETLGRVAPDLVLKQIDTMDMDEIVKRVRKVLPQGLIDPKLGEPPSQPLPPPPAVQVQILKQQTEQAKQAKEKMQLQVALVKLYKETKETDMSIRQEILKMLNELHAPVHKADIMAMRRQMQQQQIQTKPMPYPQGGMQ